MKKSSWGYGLIINAKNKQHNFANYNSTIIAEITILDENIGIIVYKSIKDNLIINDINKLCKKNNIIQNLYNMFYISIKNITKLQFEELILYLDKLDEIYPLNILEKLLSIKDLESIYPKILKNRENQNIKKINFNILYRYDKEYHDDFLNSLNFDQKLEILELNKKNTFEYNYNLLNYLIKDYIEINEIYKIVKMIRKLTISNIKYDEIYNDNNVYLKYLNSLSIDNILNKLMGDKIKNNRAFEMINYLYSLCDLSYKQNIILINILNDKYQELNDLNMLKNKIISKMITKNSNLDNEVFNELMKYDNLVEGFINLIIKKCY